MRPEWLVVAVPAWIEPAPCLLKVQARLATVKPSLPADNHLYPSRLIDFVVLLFNGCCDDGPKLMRRS